MSCPLCRKRKPRRACPALKAQICPVCCGTKRLVEIACTPDCPYLDAADKHPAAAVKRRHEQDIGALMSALGRLSQPQLQLFFVLQTFVIRFTPEGGLTRLVDADLAEAAGALAASLETAQRGVIYEQQCTAVVAEQLRRALQLFLTEIGRGAGARFDGEAQVVLRGIERGARHNGEGLSDDKNAYLDLVRRVLQERTGQKRDVPTPPADQGSRIVITG